MLIFTEFDTKCTGVGLLTAPLKSYIKNLTDLTFSIKDICELAEKTKPKHIKYFLTLMTSFAK